MRELEQQAGLQQIFMQLQQQSPEFVRSLTTTEKGQAFLNQYKKDFLNNLIDQKILEREIEQQNIELTQQEKDEFFNQQLEMIKQQQDMSEEEILEALKQQGIESMDQFKEQFLAQQESNLKIQKLIDKVDIEVTDTEARENYEENQYRQDFEQVKEPIKNQIAREKYIESLKEELDIEKML